MPSCLLIECCPYHWEVFPAWVSLLGEFGITLHSCPRLNRLARVVGAVSVGGR